jgi:hypothetical protein
MQAKKLPVCVSRRSPPHPAPLVNLRRRNVSLQRGFLSTRDCPLLPLGHPLRSGTFPVWQCLPSGWDASETEVVRATLLLPRVAREAMLASGTQTFAMTRAEVTLNRMSLARAWGVLKAICKPGRCSERSQPFGERSFRQFNSFSRGKRR